MRRVAESFRDWGRDCWCASGCDNTCGKRFGWQKGTLPEGYDHKYIYSHLGYHLKPLDLQAAIGRAQLRKIDAFVSARRQNHDRLLQALRPYEDLLILPKATPGSIPSWFGFLLTVKPTAPFGKRDIVQHLEDHLIQTRQLFAGNMTRQPALQSVKYRVFGDLTNADRLTTDSFFVGVYPGLTESMMDYMIEVFTNYLDHAASRRSAA